jgi:hypothetical protein
VKAEFPWENDKDLILDGRQEIDIKFDCNYLLGNSMIKEYTRENPIDIR